jgi:hypothetical protein
MLEHSRALLAPPLLGWQARASILRTYLHWKLTMELHGTIVRNLTSAVQSARRLRSRPVHADTMGHWADLLRHAKREISAGSDELVLPLISELEKEMVSRAGH